jgi:hypothetical protein
MTKSETFPVRSEVLTEVKMLMALWVAAPRGLRQILTFQRNPLPSYLKMETVSFSETLLSTCETTRLCIPASKKRVVNNKDLSQIKLNTKYTQSRK